MTTASTDDQRLGLCSLQTFPQDLPDTSPGMRGLAGTAGNPEKLGKADAAQVSCPPSPKVLSCKLATSTVCAELTPLLQKRGREKAWGPSYNKESLATALSGKSRCTRNHFCGNSPLAPGLPRGGTLAKERCPYNCNPVQLLAFPIYLGCALCFQSPSIYYV